jgi:hypothetical protein
MHKWGQWTYCFTDLHNLNGPCFAIIAESVMSSVVILCQYPVWWNAVSLKNIQWPHKIHRERDNKIRRNFPRSRVLWQVHFSNYHAHTKSYKSSSVNLPLTYEVGINTTFHSSEISDFLRNAIYAFTLLSGSWYLVRDVSIHHIDTMFKDQANELDSRSQLNI